MSDSRSLGRAALLGLGAGLGLAAVALLVFAVGHLSVDCQHLTTDECTLERQISNEVARTQALAALGLGFVTTGLVLFARRRPSPS